MAIKGTKKCYRCKKFILLNHKKRMDVVRIEGKHVCWSCLSNGEKEMVRGLLER
jgi:hypothetical protein